MELQIGCYALLLSEMDMVIGLKWLTQLNTYARNLQEQFMEFKWQCSNYKLYGPGIPHQPLKELTNVTPPLNNKLHEYSTMIWNKDSLHIGRQSSKIV